MNAGNPVKDSARVNERGSALVLAVFVIVLLAAMGTAVMMLSQNELRMSEASASTKSVFFLAEAGLENGRATLLAANGTVDFDTDLSDAAGPNGVFDFDPSSVRPIVDSAGRIIGLTGYGDDVPLRVPTVLGDGLYAAFLTNDPAEMGHPDPADDLDDGNERVSIYGVGTGDGQSLEVVQAIVEPDPLIPSMPPCTITLLGPTPDFYGGFNACDEATDEYFDAPKTFWGTDCAGSGGISGHFVPVVCAEGCAPLYTGDEVADEAIDNLQCGDTVVEIAAFGHCENVYQSGPHTQDDTVADVHDVLEPTIAAGFSLDADWTDCDALVEMIGRAKTLADFQCSGTSCVVTSSSGWVGGVTPTTHAGSITVVDADLTVPAGYSGNGMLIVTGTLSFDVGADWNGPILVVGEGDFTRTGTTGTGVMSGAVVVANIAGVDGAFGSADDCQGGVNGFFAARYHEADGSEGDTVYCTDDLSPANPLVTYDAVQFRQR